jgi:hypothetical protein
MLLFFEKHLHHSDPRKMTASCHSELWVIKPSRV